MNEITRTGWDVLDEARAMLRAAVATVALLAASFVLGFRLPRKARS